jgi:putative addiction module CopG family antidote
MATQSIKLSAELENFAAPFVESGRYANTSEVLHAAMDALLRAEVDEEAYDRACVAAAEEGEASGLAEGDVMARLREEFGLHGSQKP